MLQQQFDVETLHFILNQFSEDITRDCSKIIVRLLEPPSGSRFNESIKFLDKRAFASIRALLNLFEKLHKNSNSSKNLELPLSIIIHKITFVLQCNDENCNLPDYDVQCDILSIISSVFNYGFMQNSSKYLQELAEFYDYTLTCINIVKINKRCKSDCLIFKLKIVSLIYQILTHIIYSPSVAEFHEKLKLRNNLREGELFAYVILHNDKDVAIQILLDLIPRYINCFKSGEIIKIIWQQISNSMTHSDIMLSKVYDILCNFFNLSFDKSFLRDKVDLIFLLLEDENYWKLVQSALVDKDSTKRKQGLYLFKNIVDILNGTSTNIACITVKNLFYWHSDYKEELYKIYSDISVTLEFLEEQQIHIIKPVFKMVETLVEKIIECDRVDFSWILLIYQKALMHENIQVTKWGLNNLLKLPNNFFLHEFIVRKTAKLLVITLNNVNLYYCEGLAIKNELDVFFKRVTQLITAKNFFRLFIREICSQVWSAEALFFVMHSLSGIQKFSFWGKEEITEIKMFLSKAFKTQNKMIRIGVQHELLSAILGLTDEKDVSLENIILLLSNCSMRIILRVETQIWNNLIDWLKRSYTKKDVENVLEKYKKQELNKEFNERCLSLMLILFFYCYFDFKTEDENSMIINYVLDIFLSYKGASKRLYCDRSLQDQYLSIICFIYEVNLNSSIQSFIKPTLPFLKDIVLYIQTQLRQVSDLQDFNMCQLYSKTFENIIKTLIQFKIDPKILSDIYEEISKDLEVTIFSNSDISSVGLYCRIKFLSIILKLHPLEVRSNFLGAYLLKKVNEPLKKDNDYSEKTRDLQTLWGKVNSEFLEEKWHILEYLINKCHSMKSGTSFWISNEDLNLLCVEALNTGGYGVLCPVMSVLKNLLPVLENDFESRKIINILWKLIMEKRKTKEFKLLFKQFIEMLFQEAFIIKEVMQEILFEYSDLIFSDSSLAVVSIFMKHIQRINLINSSVFLFCHIIAKGLIFGPVQKRDERLNKAVCSHIISLKICHFEEMSDSLSNEIRARAIELILTLNKYFPSHQTAAQNLIKILLKMESEINKNRNRYFGDSHVHRIKHRLLQALLLLEPMLCPNEIQAEELFNWVHNCLLKDDSQPSVRYMQEWLFIKILLRHSELYCRFSVTNSCNQFKEIKKKGLCSLFSVTFHLCKLIPFDLMEKRIFCEISTILPFCFHKHFEVRLYAQAILLKLYRFAEERKLTKITREYKTISEGLTECLSKDSKGNFCMNLAKLIENFYFSMFNPLEHYSLETIFVDLPRLANVSSDEWISTKIFQFCGVDSAKIDIPLINPKDSLNDSCWLWNKFDFHAFTGFENQKSEEILVNYQKKMIPVKPLIPNWDENTIDQNPLKKDGLIVVASLIDRIPNLGGLARTCEIFGTSEYIISSLKYTEDKQFTSLSVTAEKWITIKEVKIQNLLDYIFEMKQKGYNIIGAEQALYSQPLHSIKFPRKSLLLLGNEKEGIPSNLLPLLDICVEIPQLGIIRSLNVHVTGALFIWEYAKQNLFS